MHKQKRKGHPESKNYTPMFFGVDNGSIVGNFHVKDGKPYNRISVRNSELLRKIKKERK